MEDGKAALDHAKINDTFRSYYSKFYTSEISIILMDNGFSESTKHSHTLPRQ